MGSKINVYKIKVTRYTNKMYTGKLLDIRTERKSYYGKEVHYVLKAEYKEENYTVINPISYTIDFELRIDMNKVTDMKYTIDNKLVRELGIEILAGEMSTSDLIDAFIDSLKKSFENEELISLTGLYRKIMNFCLLIAEPYTTPSQEVYIFDSGGDYPKRELRLVYYA